MACARLWRAWPGSRELGCSGLFPATQHAMGCPQQLHMRTPQERDTYTHPSASHLPAALGSPLGSGHCLHAAHNARHTPRHHSSPQSMDDSTDEAKPHRHPLRHCACPYAHTHDT